MSAFNANDLDGWTGQPVLISDVGFVGAMTEALPYLVDYLDRRTKVVDREGQV
jgi:hypothetical protein